MNDRSRTSTLFHSVASALVAMTILLVGVQNAAAQHIEDGRLIFPERRITSFSYHGADKEVLETTSLRITTREGDGPGSWLNEWRTIGEHYEQAGDAALERHDRTGALDAYLKANVYYALSWFPGNHTPVEDAAYRSQLNVYQKAGALFDVPLEVIEVPYREGVIVTYLHRPAGVENPPLVIWSGGSDQYKANHNRPVLEMNAKGLAVVTFDLPGFGESDDWVSAPDSDDAHIALLDFFFTQGGFEPQRISFVGVSWGGYFAMRIAARNDPRINAVASFCAPMHEVFKQPAENIARILETPARMTIVNLAMHLGIEPTPENIANAMRKFSLLDAGIVGQGQTINTPLLIANGTLDGSAPVSDLMMAHESAVNSDLWLLGRGDHCAVEYWPVVMPQLADWLVENFEAT
ncbi:MAG: alpha/beta hydrolase family protein [Candidatus Rariloculaceae bacterium]